MIRATSIALCNCLLQIHKVRLSRSLTSFIPSKFFLTFQSPVTLRCRNKCTTISLSSIDCSGIAQSLISRCSVLVEKEGNGSALPNPSLKDFLLEISDVVPEYARKIRRILQLKPEDVLKLLLGFQSEVGNNGIQVKKVECLWSIFRFANESGKNFKHLPKSCEVMASILIRVGKFKEVELLLSEMEIQGILLDDPEVFNCLVQGFVGEDNLEGALLIFGKMRQQCISPSLSCYRVLLDSLIRMKKTEVALGVCLDMVEMGSSLGDEEKAAFDNVIGLLCWQGKVLGARNLVKKFVASGFMPSDKVLYQITRGYCEKKDFEDLLSFFFEIKSPPNVFSGNKIMYSLCINCGSESAYLFLRELERTGFKPDEVTFGILIGWSCREGNLRNAFIYLSELLLRGLRPDLHSYNALISGMLKDGLWESVRGILDEMADWGTKPNLSTFKILLAGYCKARQFDEAKKIVLEMEKCGLIQLSSIDDLLCLIFSFLGFNPSAVRLKRDNNAGISKTEFLDTLGNGLYLETDVDEYEKRLTKVLEEFILPDFNSLIMDECKNGDSKVVLRLAAEMVRWGQELTSVGLMGLFKSHSNLSSIIKPITEVWEKRPDMIAELGADTLNLIVQAYSKNKLTSSAIGILNEMIQMHVEIEKETYTALVNSLCKTENLRKLLGCWDRAREAGWVPGPHDCKSLMSYLCKKGKFNEVFSLLETMLASYPHSRLDIIHIFLKRLSEAGFAAIGRVLVEELMSRGLYLDQKSYELLIIGLCKENNTSIAINILDDIMATSMVPCIDVCLLLIPTLCKAGRYETAIALKEIGTTKLSSSSLRVFGALMKGFFTTGKVREAFTLFQDMLLKGLSPDAEIYNLLVQGHCKVKNFDKVRELLGIIIRRDLSLSISSYRKLVCLMCMEGRSLQALYLKDLMLRHDESHDRVIYNVLIFYILRSGNSMLVGEILDEVSHKRKLLLDKVAYDFLIYGFSQCKDFSSSTLYLFTMIHQEFRPSNRSLNIVISHLCDIGELEKALELSREMESRGWILDSAIHNTIVECLISYGKLQEAECFLERMVEKCLVPERVDYNNIIRQFCRNGRLSKAVDLINVMLMKGNTPNATSYDSVVHCCCNCNKLEEAVDFHTEMLDRCLKPRIETWDKLIFSFCREGKTREAERVLMRMLEMGETPSKDAYCSMLNRYHHENNLEKASETVRAMQQSGYELDFETQWSLISKLSDATLKDSNSNNNNKGFLLGLLSKSGFSRELIR
ncbi:pentatricopeptide repeat-containing protein At5g15280 [Momordica charantia]|uniref:Pentatricopeptide repeat-containing protein At5g15280 n=1 Tax=Momordica charantia TaxID=3673 RepID=A0A6J1DDB5_MOMCH|nr:pentatricopeptide repeat-containing protein At5g15280 [Momordica charantia]XP_022152222.1 pentatricopeptide repeat-containing protein At5g15280 [Momordica charantia]XP_022152223.1 pentatricopeptide repeat-containing protein At5g15280 [Momordica charantia]XP_022152224.1 pentatricopeptide repeat-containing protein At5g15280 [Momordica charantia]XP_022152225.1 pentatricopeptide repeat-containing protein At5g15280 [Momordica charantia]